MIDLAHVLHSESQTPPLFIHKYVYEYMYTCMYVDEYTYMYI